MLLFIHLHLLPFIAYKMVIKECKSIGKNTFHQFIEEGLILDKDFTNVYPEFKFLLDDTQLKLSKVIPLLQKAIYETHLVINQSNGGIHFFSDFHVQIRDFYAAVSISQQLKLSLYKKELPKCLMQKSLRHYIKNYIYHLSEEPLNTLDNLIVEDDVKPVKKTIFSALLDLCRGVFHNESVNNVIENIVSIVNYRDHLVGLDLSYLDLSNQLFSDEIFQLRHKGQYLYPTNFEGSLLNKDYLIEFGIADNMLVSKDNQYLIAYAHDGKTINIWDIQSNRCLYTLMQHRDWVISVDLSADNKYMVSGDQEGYLIFWNFGSSIPSEIIQLERAIRLIKIFDNKVYVICQNASIRCYDLKSRKIIYHIKGQEDVISDVADIHPNCTRLLMDGSGTYEFKELDLRTGKCLQVFQSYYVGYRSIYNPIYNQIACIRDDGRIEILEATTQKSIYLFSKEERSMGYSNGIIFSNDGLYLAYGTNNMVKIWNVLNQSHHKTLIRSKSEGNLGEYEYIEDIQFGKDDKILFVRYNACHICVWNIETEQVIKEFNPAYGMNYQGCNFKNLHPDTKLNESDIEMLRTQGAIFSTKDEKVMNDLQKRFREI